MNMFFMRIVYHETDEKSRNDRCARMNRAITYNDYACLPQHQWGKLIL